jgi:electron transfer flavoprotein beta subunit
MKIVVAIKQVLDPSGITVNRRAGRITVNRENYLMDPASKNALEAALRLKDVAGAEVIALTLGPERVGDALYEALGMGADRAIDVQDAAFRRADAAIATRVLAQAVKRIRSVDLMLVGERALDTDDGQVGPRLAEALGWPLLSRALHLEVNGRVVHSVKKVGDGAIAEEADLPALVTIPRDSHPPRYAHAGRLLQAYADEKIEQWSAADLGMDAASLEPLAQVRGSVLPPERQLGARLSGTTDEIATKLASQLYDSLGLRR